MSASVVACERCRRGPAQGRTALNRNPSRRRNSQTALCETLTARAASSSSARAASDVAFGRSVPGRRRDAVPARACGVRPPCRAPPSRSHDSVVTTSPPTIPQRQTATPPSGSSRRRRLPQQHALADHWKEVGSSDAGPQSSLIVRSWVAYSGAIAPEALQAVGLMAEDRRDVGLLAITSADRLYAGWTAAQRARESGLVHSRSHIERLLAGGCRAGHRTRFLGISDEPARWSIFTGTMASVPTLSSPRHNRS